MWNDVLLYIAHVRQECVIILHSSRICVGLSAVLQLMF